LSSSGIRPAEGGGGHEDRWTGGKERWRHTHTHAHIEGGGGGRERERERESERREGVLPARASLPLHLLMPSRSESLRVVPSHSESRPPQRAQMVLGRAPHAGPVPRADLRLSADAVAEADAG
jgi:hypothetical protein